MCVGEKYLENLAKREILLRFQMYKFKLHGLVADLWPLIRIMQMTGFFLLDYYEDMSFGWSSIRAGYAASVSGIMVIQYLLLFINLMKQAEEVDDLTANTITVLFFLHSLTKFFYFAIRRTKFYRTLATWNNANSHPLFAENHSRHHATAVSSMRRLVMYVGIGVIVSGFAWTVITFFGESVHKIKDPDNMNETILEEVPRLMLRSWYPWNAMSGGGYVVSFIIQVKKDDDDDDNNNNNNSNNNNKLYRYSIQCESLITFFTRAQHCNSVLQIA